MNHLQKNERNLRRTTPSVYLAVFAALMVGSAFLSVADYQSRKRDEMSILPTALGETRWHPSGSDSLPPESLSQPLAKFNGKYLYPRARLVRKVLSDRMKRVGSSDNTLWGVYRPESQDPASNEDDSLFLMVGHEPGEPGRGLFREVGDQKYFRKKTSEAQDNAND